MATLTISVTNLDLIVNEVSEKKRHEFLNLNLEPIIFKLTHNDDGKSITMDQALQDVQQYRCWLYTCWLNPGISMPPSKKIDQFWHVHALDSELYWVQTFRLFGKHFDHFPYFGVRSESDRKNLNLSFEFTKSEMQKHFSKFIIDSSDCGNSCGNSLCANTLCDTNSCQSSCSDGGGSECGRDMFTPGLYNQDRNEDFLLSFRPDRNGKTQVVI